MKQLGYKIIENRNFDEHVCLPVEYWVPKVNSCFLEKEGQIKTVAENVFYLKFKKIIIHGTFSRLEIFQKAYGPKEMPCWPPF